MMQIRGGVRCYLEYRPIRRQLDRPRISIRQSAYIFPDTFTPLFLQMFDNSTEVRQFFRDSRRMGGLRSSRSKLRLAQDPLARIALRLPSHAILSLPNRVSHHTHLPGAPKPA